MTSALFCDEMRRECDKIWFYVKKARLIKGQEQRIETLATFRSTTELLPHLKNYYKTTIFYKQEFLKSSEFRMNFVPNYVAIIYSKKMSLVMNF